MKRMLTRRELGESPETVCCPICGASNAEDLYKNRDGEWVGCEYCLTRYDRAEYFDEIAEDEFAPDWADY